MRRGGASVTHGEVPEISRIYRMGWELGKGAAVSGKEIIGGPYDNNGNVGGPYDNNNKRQTKYNICSAIMGATYRNK